MSVDKKWTRLLEQMTSDWPTEKEEAKRLQKKLCKYVRIKPLDRPIRSVAGADASYLGDKVIGVISVFSYNDMRLIEEAWSIDTVRLPYIPGLLSFREGPSLLQALMKLSFIPDLILFDGHGICHPERFGLASHMGVILDLPTIGVAKSILLGKYEEPGPERGEWSHVLADEEIIGVVLRTRPYRKPLFISPGHLINFEDSIRVVLNCCGKFRIPEPLRRSHMVSRDIKRHITRRGTRL